MGAPKHAARIMMCETCGRDQREVLRAMQVSALQGQLRKMDDGGAPDGVPKDLESARVLWRVWAQGAAWVMLSYARRDAQGNVMETMYGWFMESAVRKARAAVLDAVQGSPLVLEDIAALHKTADRLQNEVLQLPAACLRADKAYCMRTACVLAFQALSCAQAHAKTGELSVFVCLVAGDGQGCAAGNAAGGVSAVQDTRTDSAATQGPQGGRCRT
jgi:hypothetical protein